ncbi:hypothetical protein BJY52DRAFT_1228254 [Lactarius psammicola]|nr:hypothetical protein BJY52DRAFT_1228254 [Lactarius psammicola]
MKMPPSKIAPVNGVLMCSALKLIHRLGTPLNNRIQGSSGSVDNRAETTMTVPNRAWAQFIPSPPARIQNNLGHAPVHERAGPPNMGLPWTPTLDTSITESLRRLAGSYLNNPDAYVSRIRLEPGPSGQFQVIITLEMTNTV